MRICIVDPVDTPYRADTPDRHPMGGTQAAACYLARNLAADGYDVHLWTNTEAPGRAHGVECRNLYRLSVDEDRGFDIVVLMSAVNPAIITALKTFFPPTTRFVLWIQHAHDQPGSSALADPTVRGLWDAFALVSGWQAGCYVQTFGVDPARIHIMRNAANPRFDDLFAPDEDVLTAKTGFPDGTINLVYLSAPYRGLDLAAMIFPLVRARIPQARLHVFSGPPADNPAAQRGDPLLARLLDMDGVAHVGSAPQAALPQRLKSMAVMLYPNTFAETSCIAVLEGLAAGCRVVTSNLGALPETTGCFGVLKEPYQGDDPRPYLLAFADEACNQIDFLRDNPAAASILRQQVDYARYNRWDIRVHEWEHLFKRLTSA
jgi:glycosyltransferase involved in cell wall biosynthesis